MRKFVIAYVGAAIVFGVLDSIWLSWAADNLYRPIIGDIMAENINLGAAAAFYLIYLAGIIWFAIKPGLEAASVPTALFNGILLGALCYATFDLTSQAVFKVWATKVSVMDIMWGAIATGTTSALVTWATLRFNN